MLGFYSPESVSIGCKGYESNYELVVFRRDINCMFKVHRYVCRGQTAAYNVVVVRVELHDFPSRKRFCVTLVQVLFRCTFITSHSLLWHLYILVFILFTGTNRCAVQPDQNCWFYLSSEFYCLHLVPSLYRAIVTLSNL